MEGRDMNVKNIIVATDLSAHCGVAAKWAQQFKERVGAETLIVEHVIELSLASWVKSAFEVLDDDEQRAVAEEKVAAWFEEHAGARPDEVILRAGSCVTQLVEVVKRQTGETLLVVSMSGKGALTRRVLGSTAHALASEPPCPLAIVHPEHTGMRPGAPIVTGTDLSRNGQRAVEYAANLARLLELPLDIIHAYGAPTSPLVNLKHEMAEETMTKIVTRKIERSSDLADLDARIHVLAREPGDAILTHARQINCDLIVMGHSGETPFVRALGGVSQRVLNHMPCSMIVMPSVGFDDPDFDVDEEE